MIPVCGIIGSEGLVNYLNGQWTAGSGNTFQSINPANDDVVWTGNAASVQDVHTAVLSARSALNSWKETPVEDRVAILSEFKRQLQQNQDRLARLITSEVGKPLWDAVTEVQAMIGKIDLTRQAFVSRRPDVDLTLPDGMARVRYFPIGVVAVYGPFNFPGHIANGQIVPALLAGNTVVFKPSELTPLVAQETVRLWEAAGLPPGVLNLVQGSRDTGEAIANHPDIRAILFTGSLKTGISLQKTLVGRPDVLLALELGGNNPLVVHRVNDIGAAVYWTIQSAYLTSGQRCTCARRLIVTDGNERFLECLENTVRTLQIGQPDSDPPVFLGPLIHSAAVERLLTEQERLIENGAKVLVRAERSPLGNAFVTPAILDVTECRSLSDEEVFGPLLQIHRVPDLDAAISVANQTRYGLAAALFTDDEADFATFSRSVQTGIVNWNRPTTGASGQLPFGGWGSSGNYRPAGYFMIDSCNSPVAMLESSSLKRPEKLIPGISIPD